MNNWIPALFNIGRKQNILRMFGRRRNNRWMMWTSMLGLGVSAVSYGVRRNRNRNMMNPIQNLMNNFRFRNAGQTSKMANLTKFAKEFVPNKDSNTNK